MGWFPISENEHCVQINDAGFAYEQLPCLYPNTFARFYTGIEQKFDPVLVRDWMADNSWAPLAIVSFYGVAVIMGKKHFENRPAWDWRNTMALWNFTLSLFSFIGFIRTAPQLIHNSYYYTLADNLCIDPESSCGSGATGLWMQLFTLSKTPELFDTFFILIHKKPLILLHWYHHISVLLYCWYAYVAKAPAGLIFTVMNYGVHALMYSYYFLMTIKCKPKWFKSIWITVAQISQMVVGIAATAMGFVVAPSYEGKCYLTSNINTAALIMYGSYLVLFLQFFVQRYSTKSKEPKKMKKVD